MLNNYSNYKSNNLFDTKRNTRKNLLNPYEYNLESNLKDNKKSIINNCFDKDKKIKR